MVVDLVFQHPDPELLICIWGFLDEFFKMYCPKKRRLGTLCCLDGSTVLGKGFRFVIAVGFMWNCFLQPNDAACFFTFLHSMVAVDVRRLSVCHICASCLNCSTDLDVICGGSMTHCVIWGP